MIRAARHSIPPVTRLTAPFQNDDVPYFPNLAKTLKLVPKNIPTRVLFRHPSPTHPQNTWVSLSFKKKSMEDESQRGWRVRIRNARCKLVSPQICRLGA